MLPPRLFIRFFFVLIESASESEEDDSDDERALPDILKQLQFSS